jgi:hypothetical protein
MECIVSLITSLMPIVRACRLIGCVDEHNLCLHVYLQSVNDTQCTTSHSASCRYLLSGALCSAIVHTADIYVATCPVFTSLLAVSCAQQLTKTTQCCMLLCVLCFYTVCVHKAYTLLHVTTDAAAAVYYVLCSLTDTIHSLLHMLLFAVCDQHLQRECISCY